MRIGKRRFQIFIRVIDLKVTIQDIADALGVSRNTVSKAINNSEGLADATRERILQKAVEMGYKQFSYVNALTGIVHPAAEAAQEPRGRAGEIALFSTILFNYSHFASPMQDRFQSEVAQLGYTVNLHRVTEENLREGSLPWTFDAQRVRAIVCFELFDWDYCEMLCGLGLPILFVDGPVKAWGRNLPADQLYMDNMTEIAALTQELLRRGKTRMGFLGDYLHCQSFFERYIAFRANMLMAGLPVEERFVIPYRHPAELHQALSKLEELPEVFLCANDFVAIDAIQCLRHLGKQVPRDILLCGFDDSPESRLIDPPLTTVHIHTQIMAFTAVQLLMSRMEEPSLDYRVVHTQTDLIFRASTGDSKEEGVIS